MEPKYLVFLTNIANLQEYLDIRIIQLISTDYINILAKKYDLSSGDDKI